MSYNSRWFMVALCAGNGQNQRQQLKCLKEMFFNDITLYQKFSTRQSVQNPELIWEMIDAETLKKQNNLDARNVHIPINVALTEEPYYRPL